MSTGAKTNSSESITVEIPLSRDQFFWVTALLFFGLGDLTTTSVGIQLSQVMEVGPVQAPLLEQFGMISVPGLKVAVFAFFYAIWRLISEPHNIAVPVALTVVGIAVTAWNSIILLIATVG